MNNLIGKKVELIFCADQWTRITPGTRGIVRFVDDTGTVFVDWNDGSRLGLIPKIDTWKVID